MPDAYLRKHRLKSSKPASNALWGGYTVWKKRASATLLYADESGFCLQPPLPYLWQPKGKTLSLPAKAHARRLNVLGFLSKDCRLHHFETSERLTA